MTNLNKILAETDLFSGLDQSDLQLLEERFEEVKISAGINIIRKGETGDSLFVISSGITKVHDGEDVITKLGSGSFFGEMAFFDSAPRSMSVTAESDCILYKMDREGFQHVFQKKPGILQHMVSAITKRIRNQNDRIIADLRNKEGELKKLVDERTMALASRNEELSKALTELKLAQDQLVQQEKLASLGQLTAGIAHEIKNPLNFVTNFAKLSFELLEEVISSENPDERLESGDFLRQNLQKIYEHGSRADNIVKGMLEHTRANSDGEKQLEDLNLICEQFLKIALESFRMSNPDFKVEIQLDLNPNLPKIEVASLDISKVFLNLFTNAFYSMNEKLSSSSGYTPLLLVKSQSNAAGTSFLVKDNGSGIPLEIMNKVFNPFFTTKPTGKGTGLGLSISNDIIKAHGGIMKCNPRVDVGAEFEFEIPYVSKSSPEIGKS
jgi:signal transduction histidine kinase